MSPRVPFGAMWTVEPPCFVAHWILDQMWSIYLVLFAWLSVCRRHTPAYPKKKRQSYVIFIEFEWNGHGGSPQYWIIMSERGRNILFLWNLKARVGLKPALSDFPSRQALYQGGISKTPSTPSTPSPLDPRPSTLDLISKTVFVCLYNYNCCIIITFGKFI